VFAGLWKISPPRAFLGSQREAGVPRRLIPAFTVLAILFLVALESALRAQNSSSVAPPLLPGARPGAMLSAEDDAFLEELQRASFQFFLEQSHPRTGLVRDRARADGSPSEGMASISASGFALSSWALATHRGWVTRAQALDRVRLSLRFLANEAQRHRGFFYHFMEMDTGKRAWRCELSSIDTALFLAGAIVAREYFRDPEITELVNRIYREIDWQWFLNGGKTVSMGWHDEAGFSRFRWVSYSEHMMMSMLGLGAPANELPPEYWRAWIRRPAGSYGPYHYIQGPPLFIHQFAHAYVDFRGQRDAYADYYQNSVLATLAQRQMSLDLRSEFPSWSERLWGVTSSDSVNGYKAWGGPARTVEFNALDGTVVPCATAGSLPFAPTETLMVLRHIRAVYGDRTWKKYGFVDAFNPETGWVNPDVIGIDVGITIMQAENARSGFFWALFTPTPEIQRAFARGGFVSKSRTFSWPDQERLRSLAASAWKSIEAVPVTADTMGLRLTAIPAAQALGLLPGSEAVKRARALLASPPQPQNDVAAATYSAGLVTLRQAIPALAPEASRHLAMVKWETLPLTSMQIGSASRLAAFFRIASGTSEPALWGQLSRVPEARGAVYILTPVSVADQLLPGLWLEENSVISGASASQLAYSLALPVDGALPPQSLPDVLTLALMLQHFPAEVLKRTHAMPFSQNWLEAAAPADRAALLISLANVLVPDCVRQWFQQDPLVKSARTGIPEFTQAPFGRNTSMIWRHELAGPWVESPERRTIASSATLPREKWRWNTLAGLEFKDSPADVRPDDPVLELRFAFTWDNEALRFHAETTDMPPDGKRPADRREFVELLIDPRQDGFIWRGPEDLQFVFRSTGESWEWSKNRAVPATIQLTDRGYTVDAVIPWSQLGLTPSRGLEFRVSAAVATDGRYEWEPSLKLNWRFFKQRDDRYSLGLLRLD